MKKLFVLTIVSLTVLLFSVPVFASAQMSFNEMVGMTQAQMKSMSTDELRNMLDDQRVLNANIRMVSRAVSLMNHDQLSTFKVKIMQDPKVNYAMMSVAGKDVWDTYNTAQCAVAIDKAMRDLRSPSVKTVKDTALALLSKEQLIAMMATDIGQIVTTGQPVMQIDRWNIETGFGGGQ